LAALYSSTMAVFCRKVNLRFLVKRGSLLAQMSASAWVPGSSAAAARGEVAGTPSTETLTMVISASAGGVRCVEEGVEGVGWRRWLYSGAAGEASVGLLVNVPTLDADAIVDGDVDLRVEEQSKDVRGGKRMTRAAPLVTQQPTAVHGTATLRAGHTRVATSGDSVRLTSEVDDGQEKRW
jgi:hypothetical protein